MDTIIDIIKSLPNLAHLSPATNEYIDDCEVVLQIPFAPEFREYTRHFGAISAEGIELTGAVSLARLSVVETTLNARANCHLPSKYYVVEDLGVEESLIVQDSEGVIYQYSRMTGLHQIAQSLSEYIINRC